MRLNLIKKAARSIALILRLSGRLATRKTVAMENASNAGLRKPVAGQLVEELTVKRGMR